MLAVAILMALSVLIFAFAWLMDRKFGTTPHH